MSTYNFLEAAYNFAEPVGGLHLYVTFKTYPTSGTPTLFQKGEFLYRHSWVILLSEDKSESAHGHYICVVPSIIRDEAAGNISSSIKSIYVDIYENQFDEVDGSILWAEEGGYMLLRHGEAPSQLIAGGACSHPAQEPTCTSLSQQVSEDSCAFAYQTGTDICSLRNLVLSLLVHKLSLLLSCCAGFKKSKQRINWFWPLGWKQVFSLRACRLMYLESMTKSTTGMVTAVRCEQTKW